MCGGRGEIEMTKKSVVEVANKYTYDEVYNASLKYFSEDELAAKVFVDKYALQNNGGEYLELTPFDMHKRLAKEFARIEKKYKNPMSEEEIFGLLDGFKYVIPQGSPLAGIGNPYLVQSLGNCFVINSPFDSYGGICKADQELTHLGKRRAGVGVDLSNIRPRGAPTKNAAKTSDGIGIFMERFSNTTREVAQNGRRAALMQTISIKHPDIETFIDIKKDKKKVTGANISIRITDDFMAAVKVNSDFILQWPVETKEPQITKKIKAKDLWNKIIDSAWYAAEPGILFWETIIKNSPADIYAKVDSRFETKSTNPCGEIPLGLDSCRLLVINLLSFVENPFTNKAKFNFNTYSSIVIKAQRLMDDLVDLEIEKIEQIIKKIKLDPEPIEVKSIELNMWNNYLDTCKLGRRTGTGITALGDCLAALNIKYGSKKSIEMTSEIYRQLAINAYKSSCIMAKERKSFPLFNKKLEINHPFISKLLKQDKELNSLYQKYGRRNIALNTTAPTGSVSTVTQTTSGIEPAYLLSYVRRKKINPSDKNARVDFVDQMGDKWQEFTVYHHGVKKWIEVTGEKDIKKSPYWGATSNEIDWAASVDLQAAAQCWIDHAISKTCNLPENVSKEVVSEVYMRAYDAGCKGFTVYREGSRSGVLVSEEAHSKQNLSPSDRPKDIQYRNAPKRPLELPCEIKQVKVENKAWTICIGLLNNRPYEIFAGLSKFVDIPTKYKMGKIIKNGKVDGNSTYNLEIGNSEDKLVIKDIASVFENANHGAMTRAISLNLRHGTPIQFVVEQLVKDKNSDLSSLSRIIARIFKQYIKDGTTASEKICPTCKSENSLVYQEGCISCKSCSFSKCS